MFTILQKDKNSRARLGLLKTPHGVIKTPSYVIVATHGSVKTLEPLDIKKTGTQVVIANTYHLWQNVTQNESTGRLRNTRRRVAEKEQKSQQTFYAVPNGDQSPHSFLSNKLEIMMPTMTDSGGFQVFSLGFGLENKVGKILSERAEKIKNLKRKNIKITNNGVYFSVGGKKRFLGPKLSMELQSRIGADIIFAFDECTSPLDGKKYNQEALVRTHRWAKESLKHYDPRQLLFGIIQGGKYKNLRQKSAKYIASLPFDGFAIGGSFGKDEMSKTLKWIIPHLPDKKPRHLLGIGKVEDIFTAVENGVDMFDCVIPTREARHGRIYAKNGFYDIRKSIYSKNKIHKLFKGTPQQKLEGQRLATIHNIKFFNSLLSQIRASIKRSKFFEFKKEFLKNFRV